ncbi:hypothetical protein ACHWQZ_G016671 [Mnemiopsis leidyi]
MNIDNRVVAGVVVPLTVLGILGNGFVLIIVFCKKMFKSNNGLCFLVHLSIIDFFRSLLCNPLVIVSLFLGSWPGSETGVLCKIFPTIVRLFSYTYIITLVMIAVERLSLVKLSLKNMWKVLKRRNMVIFSIASWFLAAFLAVPKAFFLRIRYLNHIGMCTYFGYDKKDPVQLALVYTDKTFPLISLVVLTASYTVFLIKVHSMYRPDQAKSPKRISKEADEDANTRPDSCPQNRNHVKRSKLSTDVGKMAMKLHLKRTDGYEISCSSPSFETAEQWFGDSARGSHFSVSKMQVVSKRFRRTCLIISGVLAVYLVTWSPYFLLKIIFFVNEDHPITKSIIFHQVAYISSILPPVLNPLLYICQYPAIKNHVGKVKKNLRRKSQILTKHQTRNNTVARKFIVVRERLAELPE